MDTATFARRAIVGKRGPSAVTTNSFMRAANNVGWRDKLPPAYVEAMRKVRTAVSPADGKAACAELNAVIEEHCWFIPITLKRSLTAMGKRITATWRDIDDRLDLRQARLSA